MNSILLMEDDEVMQNLLKTLLELEKFKVIIWNKSRDILNQIKETHPEVILLDVHLGTQDGFDIFRKLRSDPELKAVRIIMTSGLDYRHKCQMEGVDGFIMKPYDPDDLIRLLRTSE